MEGSGKGWEPRGCKVHVLEAQPRAGGSTRGEKLRCGFGLTLAQCNGAKIGGADGAGRISAQFLGLGDNV